MADSAQPTRVAILGGGIGAVAAAFWLTSTPKLRQQYQVTVYTHGWRLGGKCASGRNARQGDRIQEHGLHMLMGWYQTAFQTIRACYAEWEKGPENPFQTWRDAFTPLRQVTLTQQIPDSPAGQWQMWNVPFPRLPGSPGDPGDAFVDDVVHTVLGWLRDALLQELPEPLRPVLSLFERAHKEAQRAGAQTADQRVTFYNGLLHLLRDLQIGFQDCGERFLQFFGDKGYEICAFTEYALALLIGFVRDVAPDWERGMDELNELEFRDWLQQHGGAKPKYLQFAPVRVLYDLAFAYANGDSSSIANGRVAAGVGLRTLLMMTFAYKDAPLWKMNAGMGDTVFTPLYQVLRQRGVDVQFFRRVTNLGLSADGRQIDSIAMYRQVDTVGAYDPLVPVEADGRVLPCWPSQPKWKEIVGGEGIAEQAWDLESMWCTYRAADHPELTLQRGTDFDLVVLGMPPASLKDIGAELLARCPQIKAMYDNMSWVSTQSAQIWLKPDRQWLGWKLGPTVLSAYADPFRSWGEMSHLLPMETWCWPDPVPGSCEYFCGTRALPENLPPYGDPTFIRQQTDAVGQAFGQWLQANAARLWPAAATTSAGFNHDLLASQYYRVNVDPSEMYVQTFPGSVKHRLSPGGSGVQNLYLAGDWTKGTVNGGCAEGAFESGKLAAEAICGETLDLPLEPLPKFISYRGCGEVDFPAPLYATDDLLYAFALKSDQGAVQALVDRTLGAPAKDEIEFKVLGSHVMLVFQHCGHFTSPEKIGWAEDRETAIMIPLLEKRRGAFSLPRLVLWMPYLTIDVGLGMVTGRDVWGYNKSLGITTMPDAPTDPAVFQCQTLVFDTFAAETQGLVQPLIEVARNDLGTRGDLDVKWNDGRSLIQELSATLGPWGILGDAELLLDLAGLAIERDIPVVNLKQMRDTEYTHLAVHQSLVEAMLQVPTFHGGGLLAGSYTVKIRRCASHQILADFGFPANDPAPGTLVPVPVEFAFWVKIDFNAPKGTAIWTAS